MTDDIAEVAKGLTKAQQQLMLGDYDPEFASIQDASVLERLGLWSYDPNKQDADSEYYDLDVTPLGLRVKAYLQGNEGEV